MTVPAHTNTTAAEVLRRQVLGAVAGKCISGASAEAATDAVMDVIAGLLADPTARTEVEWGVACPLDDDVIPTADPDWSVRHHDRNCGPGHRLVRRTVTAWTVADAPAADDEGGQER